MTSEPTPTPSSVRMPDWTGMTIDDITEQYAIMLALSDGYIPEHTRTVVEADLTPHTGWAWRATVTRLDSLTLRNPPPKRHLLWPYTGCLGTLFTEPAYRLADTSPDTAIRSLLRHSGSRSISPSGTLHRWLNAYTNGVRLTLDEQVHRCIYPVHPRIPDTEKPNVEPYLHAMFTAWDTNVTRRMHDWYPIGQEATFPSLFNLNGAGPVTITMSAGIGLSPALACCPTMEETCEGELVEEP